MRFALVTTFYPPFSFGGDGIFVRHLANELTRRGHDVEVICCPDAYRALTRKRPVVAEENPRITVHRLDSGWGAVSALLTQQTGRPVLAARRLRGLLERDFDVIHFHNVSLVGGPAVLTLGRALKVYTLHDYWALCPTHLLYRYDGVPCPERRCLRCQLARRRPPQAWRQTPLLARALQHVDVCIAPSRFAAALHERELGRPVTHLPNFVPAGIETESDEARVAPTAPDEAYALYVGRIEEAKGVEELARFFAGRRRERLLIAGAGRREKALAAIAGNSQYVNYLGPLPQASLQMLYENALAVVVPSRCYELCPLVVLEAFRAGAPVVVRDIGSLPELVADGCGLVYRNDGELARHLTRLRVEPALGRALGRRGREAWAARFSPNAHMQRYLEIVQAADLERRERAEAR